MSHTGVHGWCPGQKLWLSNRPPKHPQLQTAVSSASAERVDGTKEGKKEQSLTSWINTFSFKLLKQWQQWGYSLRVQRRGRGSLTEHDQHRGTETVWTCVCVCVCSNLTGFCLLIRSSHSHTYTFLKYRSVCVSAVAQYWLCERKSCETPIRGISHHGDRNLINWGVCVWASGRTHIYSSVNPGVCV